MNLLKTQQDSEPEAALETAMAMVASALSDPSRVSILCALMDGRAWTATELSTIAEVSASTTSGHLARLLSNGLVVCLAQGRHRYYRLAGPHIAGLLENLMGVSMQAHKALATSTLKTLPKLELAVILMYLSMLAKVRRPSITPSSSTIRLFSSRMISAASRAISTAPSTEMPMSAARSAGASLMPSPIKPTV